MKLIRYIYFLFIIFYFTIDIYSNGQQFKGIAEYLINKEIKKIYFYQDNKLLSESNYEKISLNQYKEITKDYYLNENYKTKEFFLNNDNVIIYYYSKGEVSKIIKKQLINNYLIHEEIIHNELNFLTKEKKEYKTIYKYIYEKNLLKNIDVSSDSEELKRIQYEYKDGLVIKENFINKDGKIEITEYEYDKENNNNYTIYNPKNIFMKYYKIVHKERKEENLKIIEDNLFRSKEDKEEHMKYTQKWENDRLKEYLINNGDGRFVIIYNDEVDNK